MNKQKCLNESGLTLVELLAGLAIGILVITLITSNLIGGMNSYKSVNQQISLHDEGNYVMTQFVNQIYVATKVADNIQSTNQSLIDVTNYKGKVTTLGFQNDKAFINGQVINSSQFKVDCVNSKVTIDNNQNTVLITIVVKDVASGKNFELNNKVSYVKVQ